MSISISETNFYKKNGFLIKKNLISEKDINKLNTTSTMGVRSKFASDLSLGFLLKFINP